MKFLFWLLLTVVMVAVVALFASLLAGLRRRRGADQGAASPVTAYRATAPLSGRQAELYQVLRRRWPERTIMCDVPYARFLVGGEVEGVAPILVCDEALMPRAVVVWDDAVVPQAALAAAGIDLLREE